jgi:hypothetical protein
MILGVGSPLLKFIGTNVTPLIWVDSWGDAMGYVLRAVVTALGFYWSHLGNVTSSI